MKKIAHILTSALMLLVSASAQREPRCVDTFDSSWTAVGPDEWSLDRSGRVIFNGSASSAAEGSSAIVVPGGVHSLAPRKCLLCGMDAAGQGVIEVWEYVPGSGLSIVQSRVLYGMDIVGAVYHAPSSSIYLLDASGSRIVRGTWDGHFPLTYVALATYANGDQVAELATAADHTLDVGADGSVRMIRYPAMRGREGHVLDVSGPTLQLAPLAGPGFTHPAYAIPELSSEGGTSVSVRATQGVSFQIVRASNGAVIGSGVGQGASSVVTVTTTEPLVLGERYSAQVPGAGSAAPYQFECVRRYGTSETLSDGTSMMPFFYQLGAASGSIFNIHLALQSPPQVFDRSFSCYLLVAFRLPSDPVVQIGSNFLLSTSTFFPVTGWIPANLTNGHVALDVPIPAGMAGLVFLVQFAVVDGSQWKVSQIYGSAID
jgi:hypothetical protein